jgi:hypothetical protein
MSIGCLRSWIEGHILTNCHFPLLFLAALPSNHMPINIKNSREMMRKSYIAAGAIVTAIATWLSGAAVAEPLAPGKPAGVRAAQMGNKEWLVFGGLGALAVGLAVATSGGGHNTPAAQSITASIPTTS